jgi:hypothetical protein
MDTTGTDVAVEPKAVPGSPPAAEACCSGARQSIIRRLSVGRWLMIALALVALVGLPFGWRWLAAFSIAPAVLSILPCLVMCGLGLCIQNWTAPKGGDESARLPGRQPAAPDEHT